MVPELEAPRKRWPSLGDQVCDFITENLCHGPGDLRGQPVRLDDEKRALIYRMYEVFPKSHRLAGRRRFKRVAISLRKGSAKTEFAAWLAACELHPEGPVRVVEWKRNRPIGAGVVDPYIPLVAYTEEQSEELAYGALRVILENCKLGEDFDIGLGRIMRLDGDGKAEALSAAPEARDGARTTFQVFDETHRFTLPRLKHAHRTMLANIPKRQLADAWSFEITTAPAPGEQSVAESTMAYAAAVEKGKLSDARLFFYHRQASDGYDLTKKRDIRKAVIEASGPVAEWSDIEGIVGQWDDPTTDRAYLERVWLNRLVRASAQAFDVLKWRELVREGYEVAPGALITLGFDGSRYQDATAIVGTEIETGYQWVVGAWERPPHVEDWEVPQLEVKEAMADAFERWNVWRLYADPPYWETTVAEWSGEFGEERVIRWSTNQMRKMAEAVRAFANAILDGDLQHSEDERYERHIGNSHRRVLTLLDDKGEPLWVIQKERPDSPKKIDVAMAGILSWTARRDAVAEGVEPEVSIYNERFESGGEIIDAW